MMFSQHFKMLPFFHVSGCNCCLLIKEGSSEKMFQREFKAVRVRGDKFHPRYQEMVKHIEKQHPLVALFHRDSSAPF